MLTVALWLASLTLTILFVLVILRELVIVRGELATLTTLITKPVPSAFLNKTLPDPPTELTVDDDWPGSGIAVFLFVN